MARKILNLGSGAGVGDGESLHSALNKVNENFAETYSDIASHDARLIALEDGHVITDIKGSVHGDDSMTLVNAVNSQINLDGTVKGDIIPDANIAYDIGSPTKRFKDLYLSGNTINLGNQTLSTTASGLTSSGTITATKIQLGTATITSSGSGVQISGNLSTGSGITKSQGLVGFNTLTPTGSGQKYLDKVLLTDAPAYGGETYNFGSGYYIYDSGGVAKYDRAEYLNYQNGNPAVPAEPFAIGAVMEPVVDGNGALIGVSVGEKGEQAGPGDNLLVQCLQPENEVLTLDTAQFPYNVSWNGVVGPSDIKSIKLREYYVNIAGYLIGGYVRDTNGVISGFPGKDVFTDGTIDVWDPELINNIPYVSRRVRYYFTYDDPNFYDQNGLIRQKLEVQSSAITQVGDEWRVSFPLDVSGKFIGLREDIYQTLKFQVDEELVPVPYKKTLTPSASFGSNSISAVITFNPYQGDWGTLAGMSISGGSMPASDLTSAQLNELDNGGSLEYAIDLDSGAITETTGDPAARNNGEILWSMYFKELGAKVLPLVGYYEDYQSPVPIAGSNASTVLTPGPEPIPDPLANPPVIIADGTLAAADGSTWDPNGDGTQALMIWLNGQWNVVNLTPVP